MVSAAREVLFLVTRACCECPDPTAAHLRLTSGTMEPPKSEGTNFQYLESRLPPRRFSHRSRDSTKAGCPRFPPTTQPLGSDPGFSFRAHIFAARGTCRHFNLPLRITWHEPVPVDPSAPDQRSFGAIGQKRHLPFRADWIILQRERHHIAR